jgi:hypothetical protein
VKTSWKIGVELLVRYAALVAMTIWLGGFTFYASIVIPILHEELGGLDAGQITGQVAKPLNGFGAVAIAAWWVLAVMERSRRERWACWMRVGLLGVTTAILVGLIVLHPILETRLESESRQGFYALHKIYLIASTGQWGVNLGLLAITLWIWRPEPNCAELPDERRERLSSGH